jgi:hypothetical protein
VATSTPSAIRDQVRTILSQVDPVSLTGTRFRDFRNEGKADFREWAEAHPTSALRRYQVRNIGNDEPPEVSNTVFETRRLTLEILIAYPQDNRAGRDNAMDRDDIIDEDWDYIDFNIGLCGRVNFYTTHDCTPLGCTKEIERGTTCDFMVIRAEYQYQRALAIGGLAEGVGGPP